MKPSSEEAPIVWSSKQMATLKDAEGQKFLYLAGILQKKLMEKYSIDAKGLKSGTFIFTFVRHPFQRIVSID